MNVGLALIEQLKEINLSVENQMQVAETSPLLTLYLNLRLQEEKIKNQIDSLKEKLVSYFDKGLLEKTNVFPSEGKQLTFTETVSLDVRPGFESSFGDEFFTYKLDVKKITPSDIEMMKAKLGEETVSRWFTKSLDATMLSTHIKSGLLNDKDLLDTEGKPIVASTKKVTIAMRDFSEKKKK